MLKGVSSVSDEFQDCNIKAKSNCSSVSNVDLNADWCKIINLFSELKQILESMKREKDSGPIQEETNELLALKDNLDETHCVENSKVPKSFTDPNKLQNENNYDDQDKYREQTIYFQNIKKSLLTEEHNPFQLLYPAGTATSFIGNFMEELNNFYADPYHFFKRLRHLSNECSMKKQKCFHKLDQFKFGKPVASNEIPSSLTSSKDKMVGNLEIKDSATCALVLSNSVKKHQDFDSQRHSRCTIKNLFDLISNKSDVYSSISCKNNPLNESIDNLKECSNSIKLGQCALHGRNRTNFSLKSAELDLKNKTFTYLQKLMVKNEEVINKQNSSPIPNFKEFDKERPEFHNKLKGSYENEPKTQIYSNSEAEPKSKIKIANDQMRNQLKYDIQLENSSAATRLLKKHEKNRNIGKINFIKQNISILRKPLVNPLYHQVQTKRNSHSCELSFGRIEQLTGKANDLKNKQKNSRIKLSSRKSSLKSKRKSSTNQLTNEYKIIYPRLDKCQSSTKLILANKSSSTARIKSRYGQCKDRKIYIKQNKKLINKTKLEGTDKCYLMKSSKSQNSTKAPNKQGSVGKTHINIEYCSNMERIAPNQKSLKVPGKSNLMKEQKHYKREVHTAQKNSSRKLINHNKSHKQSQNNTIKKQLTDKSLTKNVQSRSAGCNNETKGAGWNLNALSLGLETNYLLNEINFEKFGNSCYGGGESLHSSFEISPMQAQATQGINCFAPFGEGCNELNKLNSNSKAEIINHDNKQIINKKPNQTGSSFFENYEDSICLNARYKEELPNHPSIESLNSIPDGKKFLNHVKLNEKCPVNRSTIFEFFATLYELQLILSDQFDFMSSTLYTFGVVKTSNMKPTRTGELYRDYETPKYVYYQNPKTEISKQKNECNETKQRLKKNVLMTLNKEFSNLRFHVNMQLLLDIRDTIYSKSLIDKHELDEIILHIDTELIKIKNLDTKIERLFQELKFPIIEDLV